MQHNFGTKKLISRVTIPAVAGVVMAVAGSAAHAQPPMQVTVDGQPLNLGVDPITQNGRLLVPMRPIFQQLGARVTFNSLNGSILAERGTTTVVMALGSNQAKVNQQVVVLDAPATAYYGRTMVPLRFVSEAMGATVDYQPYRSLVAIDSRGLARMADGDNGGRPWPGRHRGDGGPNGGPQGGNYHDISIPAETVIPVTLDQRLSSADASVGQTFTATVVSQQLGDSEFPAGTKIEGVVNEVERKNGDEPGVLGLGFRTAILSDGTRIPLRGGLVSLDSDAVTNNGGRLTATPAARGNDTMKAVGIGAVGGFAVGRLLKKNGLTSALLGAAGGFLYDKSRNRDKGRDAVIESGARIGVRLRQDVTYRDTTNYYERRSTFIRM